VLLTGSPGLDRALPVQYVRWMAHVLRGDLGRSIPLGREVGFNLLGDGLRDALDPRLR
jgi:hypothetical protein